jgi:hypothetical protein
MPLLRRFGGTMVLLLSAAGTIACAGGIIGIWMFYPGVSEKVQTIAARLDVALQRAAAADQNVRRAIERARADVAAASSVGRTSSAGERLRWWDLNFLLSVVSFLLLIVRFCLPNELL